MLAQPYQDFCNAITRLIPAERIFHDPLRTLSFGTDASFYRLIPQLVIDAHNEQEIIQILAEASARSLPVTFRGAGTSLSGQAISDSILILTRGGWSGHRILSEGRQIALEPAVIGAHANLFLAPYGRKIGPDPASINSAMIGGIAANNASGMCCGTAQNSYRTLVSLRVILHDGTILDTGDTGSRARFLSTHTAMVEKIESLMTRVRNDAALSARIRSKFAMKNTTGYSLNALVDFDTPIDVLQHLMIGSEGTLGFISEITYDTVPEHPCKASALIIFPDIATACTATAMLKEAPVDAVELMDRASLRSVEGKDGMPEYLPDLHDDACSLLVETRAARPDILRKNLETISAILEPVKKTRPLAFTDDPAEGAKLWNIRKGLFPSVGAMRKTGTTVIIEDVAFPLSRLAEAAVGLRRLFANHGYENAILFGHALEGNLHFVITQDFNTPAEVERYKRFIADMTTMVVNEFDGSLKAEHGTGRNMAPFVELEWGALAYGLMREIKTIFDPRSIINPGVIMNADADAHVKNLKPLPPAHALVDKCIECGFCEVHCPSKNLTLTPRQRIAVYREIARLHDADVRTSIIDSLQHDFEYAGNATCATDGLCATSCPVGIDTGKLIKELRFQNASPFQNALATLVARNMSATTAIMRAGLTAVHALHRLIGTPAMKSLSEMISTVSPVRVPVWNQWFPKAAQRVRLPKPGTSQVVYFPSCINRTMGSMSGENVDASVTEATISLLEKAGFEVIFPENLDTLCCGMAFDSKGYREQGAMKARELEAALLKASREGAIPIYVDMSPCLYRMKETLDTRLRLFEPIEFILTYVAPRLEFRKIDETVAIHTTCSSIKMGLAEKFKSLAEMCATHVVVPHGVECCGWAGDRGFTYPELNASALRDLRANLEDGCAKGYSTSRTCEIGLSLHGAISYSSIVYLVDRCTVPK